MFQEHDVFTLAKPLPNETEVSVGEMGVVLLVHGGVPCVYEVEFVNTDGINRGGRSTFALTEDYMLSAAEAQQILAVPQRQYTDTLTQTTLAPTHYSPPVY